MELQQLVDKANSSGLTATEQQDLFAQMNGQLLELKQQDPAKYLELLKQLNEILEQLNRDLKVI